MHIPISDSLVKSAALSPYTIGILLLFLFSSIPLYEAVSAPVVNTEIRRIKQERQSVEKTLKKLQQELKLYQTKLASVSKQEKLSIKTLENLRRQIQVTEKLIKENQNYLVALDSDIDRVSGELRTNKQTHARLSSDFGRTAVSVYKYGRRRDVEQLFASGSINEAVVRSQYMNFFTRAVSRDAQQLQKNAVQLENNRLVLRKRYNEKAAVVRDQEQQLKTYAENQHKKEAVLKRLKKDKEQYTAQLNTAKVKRRQLQSKIQSLVLAEQKAIAAERARQQQLLEARRLEQARLARERAATAKKPSQQAAKPKKSSLHYTARQKPTFVPDYSSKEIENVSADFDRAYGSLPWPVRGGVVSQKFGTSQDRDLKIVTTNNGIDISVPVGTPVRAVSGGKVAQIAYLPTFGNIVIIRHPKSYLTVYANLGALNVAKNDIIKSQQLIGVSGKMPEGGSVVHFEIWKGRAKQNPELWLRR